MAAYFPPRTTNILFNVEDFNFQDKYVSYGGVIDIIQSMFPRHGGVNSYAVYDSLSVNNNIGISGSILCSGPITTPSELRCGSLTVNGPLSVSGPVHYKGQILGFVVKGGIPFPVIKTVTSPASFTVDLSSLSDSIILLLLPEVRLQLWNSNVLVGDFDNTSGNDTAMFSPTFTAPTTVTLILLLHGGIPIL